MNGPIRKKTQLIEEAAYGLYIWKTEQGLVSDGEGRYLCIPSTKGNISKINQLKAAAKHYGVEEGKPIWFSGNRTISDEEYENQKSRLEWGLIPDEYDLPAIKEDLIERKKKGLI
jgi:hypothetical protein